MLFAFLLRVYTQITLVHFIIGAVLFAGLFMIFRIYVFRERIFETVIDKGRRVITLELKGIIGGKARSYPMGQLEAVNIRRVDLQPENIDGIKVVEKIALQHGTVIPGFGKTLEIVTVGLGFKDGKEITIFSSMNESEADDIVNKIKSFLREENKNAT